jgi:hypothetical protein
MHSLTGLPPNILRDIDGTDTLTETHTQTDTNTDRHTQTDTRTDNSSSRPTHAAAAQPSPKQA